MSRAAGWVLLAVALVLSRPAEAAQAQKVRVAVVRPEGRQGEALRKVLVQELGKKGSGREVLPARTVDAQVRRIRGGPKTDDQRQALAEKLGANALVTASVKGTKRWDVEVRVYDGKDGALLAEERWSVRPNRAFPEVRRELERKLGGALREAGEQRRSPPPPAVVTPPPPTPEPEVAPPAPIAETPRPAPVTPPAPTTPPAKKKKEEPPAKPPEEKAVSERPKDEPTLEVLLSGQALFRRFDYTEIRTGPLPDYSLDRAAAAGVGVTYFPLSHFTDGVVRNLGLVVRGSRAIGLSSRTPDGTEFATTAQLVEGGLRFRLPLSWLTVSAGVLYGTHSFDLELPPDTSLDLPDVDYRFAHVELGLHKALTERWAIAARVGYQHVLSAGELSSDTFFPELSGSGLNAELAVEFALTRSLGLRLGGEMRRYTFTTNAEEEAPIDAGGALDRYFTGQLGLYLRH